jgi:drug/metabolite transporter (DMT)-like permease
MELLGVGLGVIVALLWGIADMFATLATRTLTPFKVTFVAHTTGLLSLFVFGSISLWRWHLSFTQTAVLLSALIGIFTGLCAALASFSLYRALTIGPVAIAGPLTSTSSTFTLLLSAFILKEHLTLERRGLVLLIIFGIVLASTNLAELRVLLKKTGSSPLWGRGIQWAMISTLAFGALDFGIGASSSVSGWFLPALWTRFFSLSFLALLSWGRHHQCLSRAHSEETSNLSLPCLQDLLQLRKPFSMGSGIVLAFLVGMLEVAALLVFSIDTRIVTTGISSAIASSYGLIVLLFGIIVYRERLVSHQLFGIALFMVSLFYLAQ